MDQILFALPILPGKTEAARAFLQELEGGRKEQFAASEQRLGVVKEVWAIQETGHGDLFVVYAAGRDISDAIKQFVASPGEIEQWFMQQLRETTGKDEDFKTNILADYQASGPSLLTQG